MKKDLIYIIIILLLIGGAFAGKGYYENQLNKKDLAYKELVLKNDVLVKVNETQSTKLVDDTQTIKDLNKKIDSLGIKLEEKPKVITEIVYVPKEVTKPVDSISVENIVTDNATVEDTEQGKMLTIKDSYPNKENPFVTYFSRILLETQEGEATWTFTPIKMSVVLSQRADGIWKSDVKVPEFITVEQFDIIATPLDIPEIDKFGVLVGGGIGQEFLGQEAFYRLEGGVRFKKLYIDLGINSNISADAVIKFEF